LGVTDKPVKSARLYNECRGDLNYLDNRAFGLGRLSKIMLFARLNTDALAFWFLGLACLGNPDPVGMKVYCPTGKETFDDETTEEAPPRRDRGDDARRHLEKTVQEAINEVNQWRKATDT